MGNSSPMESWDLDTTLVNRILPGLSLILSGTHVVPGSKRLACGEAGSLYKLLSYFENFGCGGRIWNYALQV